MLEFIEGCLVVGMWVQFLFWQDCLSRAEQRQCLGQEAGAEEASDSAEEIGDEKDGRDPPKPGKTRKSKKQKAAAKAKGKAKGKAKAKAKGKAAAKAKAAKAKSKPQPKKQAKTKKTPRATGKKGSGASQEDGAGVGDNGEGVAGGGEEAPKKRPAAKPQTQAPVPKKPRGRPAKRVPALEPGNDLEVPEQLSQEEGSDNDKAPKFAAPKKAAAKRKGKDEGKARPASFARRFQPKVEPGRTVWSALRQAFEEVVQDKVSYPSSLQDRVLSFLAS